MSHFKLWAILNKVAIKIQVQFIHSPNKGHLSGFQVLDIMNKADVSIYVQVLFA